MNGLKTPNLNLYNNHWYHPASKIKIISWMLFSYMFFQSGFPFPSKIKHKILKAFGAKLGKGIVIKPSVKIKYPWFLSIGDYSWIGENVWIDNLAQVSIGSHCCLSQGCYLLTGNHDYKKSTFDLMVGEINIENGAWVGSKSIVCPNVTLFNSSILTVGSIATKNLDAYGIYQGNPAIKVKQRVIS